jgi:two-component system, response regulator
MANDAVEILLVEDNPSDRQLALYALRKANLANHVEEARDGEEALDFIFCRGSYAGRSPSEPPRLVLLDLKLPKIDGLEVLAEIRNNPTTRSVPVVVMTSSKEDCDVVASYKLGVNSYIQKPVDFEQFRAIIQQVGYYWLVVNQSPPPATPRHE